MNSPLMESFSSLKSKRDRRSWSCGQDDLKPLSSLDKNLHQSWKHAKSELNGHCGLEGSMPNLSRLDKARSFAKKDALARSGAKSGGFASGNTEKRSAAGKIERRALERGKMQRSSSSPRKGHGNIFKQNAADEKQERVWKSSEDDVRKGLPVSALQKENLKRGRSYSKHTTAPSDNDTLTAPLGHGMECNAVVSLSKSRVSAHGDTSLEHSRHSTEKDCFKRITKLKIKHSSAIETSDASKDSKFSRIRVKEEKQLACSLSKSNNGSSEELSWKSSSSAIVCKVKKPLPSSCKFISADRPIAETPLPFLHVTRRARSERRRDDLSKSQLSKGDSLDGFSAELEEALLKKQEAEVDSEEQHVAGWLNKMADAAATTFPSNDVGEAIVSANLRGPDKGASVEVTDEREEGELEPEDEVAEKHRSEGGNDGENGEGLEMQVEKTSDSEDEKVCKEPSSCQQTHCEPSRDIITSYAADGSKDALEIVKTQYVTVSETIKDPDVVIKEEQKMVANRSCEKDLDGGREDNVNLPVKDKSKLPVINLNSLDLMHPGSILKVQQTGTSSQARTDSSARRIDPLDTTPHRTHEGVDSHGHLNTPMIGDKHVEGDLHMQIDGGDIKDSTLQVEELDEVSISGHKQKRLKVESLELSLALPECLSGLSKIPPTAVENDSSRTHVVRRTQSLSHLRTETMSNEFTTSLSLSSFVHNHSCSLDCTSHEDQELSCVGSRKIPQGRWATSGGDDRGVCDVNKSVTSLSNIRIESHQDIKSFGIGTGHAHTAGAIGYGSDHAAQRNHQFASGHGSLFKQDTIHMVNNQAPSSMQKSNSERSKGKEVKSLSNVKLGLLEISSEPIAAMAQKLQELPDSFLEGLKGLVKELLGSFAKREEFLVFQQIIRTRTDLTEETLQRAHPTQLEILVALKTGLQSFVEQGAKSLTYKALIQIFLQTRCRNVACQQLLPVDGCECKVCSEKKGFCHECMCMVCSKFDSDSNTSRWVGCDVCMHWCHTDCGIRMSHIKSTPVSHSGAQFSEMQFQCLSCDHYMELYGFVKGVFENFSSSWGAESLAKELDCVRRIFHGSEDTRGKQLRWKAEEMLQMLERNVPVQDVCSSTLHFFFEDGTQPGKSYPVASKTMQPSEVVHHMEGASKPLATMGSVVARKLSNLVEDKELERGDMDGAELVKKENGRVNGSQNSPSIIGEKLTDVLMYQARADAAREDAINLQRIISFKAKKLEEAYSLESTKLRIEAAEEQRRKRLEELQALEKSHHEYEIMKLRIELDMKHLMMKFMEKSRLKIA